MPNIYNENTLNSIFYKPLIEVYETSNDQRKCPEITDIDFLRMGVDRTVSAARSGHAFLQDYRKEDGKKVAVGHFFHELSSPRRFLNLQSVNQDFLPYLRGHLYDELSTIEELKKWHLYAGDGHYHASAAFDEKRKANLSTRKPSKSATGHFFKLDLRTHHLGYLDLAQPKDGKKSEHDMKMLKRQDLESLRAGARQGEKVLYLWDRACIDYEFWNKAKSQKGIYFATLAKSNSVTKKIRTHRELDYIDGRSEGVQSDDLVETSKGYEIRRIIYTDPKDGAQYTYLTNEMTLEAWIIVLLYKHRWDIEKVFDALKTKLEEQKSWASSKEAKMMHAHFLCLTHNLMLLVEQKAQKDHGMEDLVEQKKKVTREKTKLTGWRAKLAASFINSFFARASQRTFRFIRWLRKHLRDKTLYLESMNDLADIWGCKIQKT